jgi:hypothetical protein
LAPDPSAQHAALVRASILRRRRRSSRSYWLSVVPPDYQFTAPKHRIRRSSITVTARINPKALANERRKEL